MAQQPREPSQRWAKTILASIETHPALLAHQSKVSAMKQSEVAAQQPLYNPELVLDWAMKEYQSSDANFLVGFTQTLDWAGKREAAAKMAGLSHASTASDFSAAKERLLAGALQAVVDRTLLQRRYGQAQHLEQAVSELVHLLQLRQRAGDLSKVELELGYLALAESLEETASTEQRLYNAREAVANFMVDAPVSDFLPTDRLPELSDAGDIPQLAERLPGVVAASLNYEASRADIELARRNSKPDPTVGVIGGKNDDAAYVGLSVSIPLPVRNSFKANIQAVSEQAKEAEQRYRERLIRAQSRLRAALSGYRGLLQRWRQWRTLTAHRLQLRQTLLHRMWDSGEITMTEYIVQLRQRAQSIGRGIELERTLWTAWIEWLTASAQAEHWLSSLARDN